MKKTDLTLPQSLLVGMIQVTFFIITLFLFVSPSALVVASIVMIVLYHEVVSPFILIGAIPLEVGLLIGWYTYWDWESLIEDIGTYCEYIFTRITGKNMEL